jgi:hypothetical protein
MTFVHLKLENDKWVKCPPEEKDLSLNVILKSKLDNVNMIIKKKFDCAFIISGGERTGKSTLGITCGMYLSNNTLTMDNFASGMDDCTEKIKNLPEESVLIVDESSLVFSSADAIKKEQKQLLRVLDVVGQKRLKFIIILPAFHDLNKQIATRRSRFLLHVYTDKALNRGFFSYYGEKTKKRLYIEGKKNYGSMAFPEPEWDGRFNDYIPPFNDEYLRLKKKSLMESLGETKSGLTKDAFYEVRKKILELCRSNVSDIKHKHYISNDQWAANLGINDRSVSRIFSIEKNIKGNFEDKYKKGREVS